jgi:hypothetical protein
MEVFDGRTVWATIDHKEVNRLNVVQPQTDTENGEIIVPKEGVSRVEDPDVTANRKSNTVRRVRLPMDKKPKVREMVAEQGNVIVK